MKTKIEIINNISFSWSFPNDIKPINAIAFWFLPKKKMQKMMKDAIKEAYEKQVTESVENAIKEAYEKAQQKPITNTIQ